MEDKRTLLAFLLIGVILFGMPYYLDLVGMGPPPEGEPPASSEQTLTQEEPTAPSSSSATSSESTGSKTNTTATPADPTEPERSSQSVEALTAQPFTPRQIVVQTPFYRFAFSTAGGDLVSAELLKYQLSSGADVQLVPANMRGLALSFEERDQALSLSDFEFVPDKEQVFIESGQNASLSFSANLGNGRRLVKTYTFDGSRYGFEVSLDATGFEQDGTLYFHWNKGIPITEEDPEIDLIELRAISYMNEDLTEIRATDDVENYSNKGNVRWTGIRNKYFLSAIVPLRTESLRINLYGEPRRQGPPDLNYSIGMDVQRNNFTWDNLVYLGPLDYEELVAYEVELERAMDLGWPIIREISKVLIILFVWAHTHIPNYGVVIILFAVFVKLLLFPFTRKTYESTAKMQELQPKIAALREKYKNDNQRLSQETMKLYREEGVNPLGGCLPLLPQMPIFFALYQVFSSTIELRQAPFILWIDDLSVPDEILIAGIGIHILPLLMALSMFFQQKMTMKDPKQAFLVYLMPVMMIFFFWTISSGLVLYWTVFNVLTIGQQLLTNRNNPT